MEPAPAALQMPRLRRSDAAVIRRLEVRSCNAFVAIFATKTPMLTRRTKLSQSRGHMMEIHSLELMSGGLVDFISARLRFDVVSVRQFSGPRIMRV